MATKHWIDPDDPKLSFFEIESEFESMSNNIARMSDNVAMLTTILKDKVDEIQKDLKEWRSEVDKWRKTTDDQLNDIHHCRKDHQKLLDNFETHVMNDKPIEHHLGKWAMGIVAFIATIAGSFVVNRILHIVGN